MHGEEGKVGYHDINVAAQWSAAFAETQECSRVLITPTWRGDRPPDGMEHAAVGTSWQHAKTDATMEQQRHWRRAQISTETISMAASQRSVLSMDVPLKQMVNISWSSL